MEVRDALSLGRQALSGKTEHFARDVALLLAHALGCTVEDVYLHPERVVTPQEYDAYLYFLKRRINKEPVAYILGYKEFMGKKFKVDKRVLIPRPETEILVETALKIMEDMEIKDGIICDVCCGSGAVGLSLMGWGRFSCFFRYPKEAGEPSPSFILTDISQEALEVARENARNLGLDCQDGLRFLHGDCLEPLRGAGLFNQVDLIVSNPPYIPSGEIEHLDDEIKNFEPILALDGGACGTRFINTLIEEAPDFLKSGGHLLIEIGHDQASLCKQAVGEGDHGSAWSSCWTVQDYSGTERVFVARRR